MLLLFFFLSEDPLLSRDEDERPQEMANHAKGCTRIGTRTAIDLGSRSWYQAAVSTNEN